MKQILLFTFMLSAAIALLSTPAFALPPEATDRLLIVKNIPENWKVLSWAPPGNGDGGPAEFRPADQLGEHSTDSIKIRSFNNGSFRLSEFARGLTRFNSKEQCTYYSQSTPEFDTRNGFESVSVVDICSDRKTTGMGDITIYKAISSPGWIMVGERTIRLPAVDEKTRPAATHFEVLKQWARGVYLCANDGSNRDCPAIR